MANEGLRIVISGPSGVGKDTAVKKIVDRLGNIAHIVVTFTDRDPRPGEVDKKDYNFVSTQEFLDMKDDNQFYEYANYAGCFKGTSHKSLQVSPGNVLIWRIEPTMAARVLNENLFANVIVCYLGVHSLFDLRARQKARGQKLDLKRLREDWGSWEEHKKVFFEKGHVIINEPGELEQTVQQVLSLVHQ